MKSVIANKSFGSLLTKGSSYELVRIIGDNYVVLDNDGIEVGFDKEWFSEPKPFDAEKFAHSIMLLMLFPKSKDFTDEDLIKGKAFATLVIETVKSN